MHDVDRRRRQELYRLIVARSDVQTALHVCHQALKLSDEMRTRLYRVFHDCIIVNYSKPFSANRPFGPLPKKWHQFTNPQLADLHEDVLELRNTVVAHSDGDAKKVTIHFQDPIPGIPGRFINEVSLTHYMLPLSSLPAVLKLCEDLEARIDSEALQLMNQLFDFKDYQTNVLELNGESLFIGPPMKR